ncbi:MAG: hypothetical protein ACREF4_18235 [Gammaproteobacteria bacterium]
MAAPASAPDDLEAVRAVVDALKAFPAEEQRRILRWAQEKLGLPTSSPAAIAPTAATSVEPGGTTSTASSRPRDIRAFLQEKRPSSDNQFAAAVAYYFAFEAPDSDRRSEITAADLQHAARLSGRERLKRPIETLHNASKRGYLDKGRARGSFRINTVGENLVAMAMPGTDAEESGGRRRPDRKRLSTKTRPRRRK